jgi:hypothetical protein
MQIKEAIRLLRKYDEEEEIIVAWWDRSAFDAMTDTEWEEATISADNMDWSSTHEDLMTVITH